DRVAVVAPRAGIDDHAVGVVVRVVDPADVLALAVRLPAARGHAGGVGPVVDPPLQLVEAEPAVELRVASPEHVEVRAVQDDDLHQWMRLSRAARTSLAGRASTLGPPGVSSTTLMSSPLRFLSRRSACQARSRSTATGRGSSAARTGSPSRPERPSAPSRPRATASPCGRSKSAAASSACAKVWPRLSQRRGPRSCGSRRQRAALYAA